MHQIVYDATPDEQRNRLTVFFRVILAIPQVIMLTIYGIGLMFAVLAAWFVLLFTGRYPAGLYAFVANVVRYTARVSGYMYVLVDKYPPFDLGEHPEYPVRLHVAPPLESYSRLKVLFRVILLIPVYIVYYVLSIVSQLMAVLIWIIAVILGRTPQGLADVMVFCLSYAARASAYFALLSEDWPQISQDPGAVTAAPAGFSAPAPAPAASTTPPPPPPPPGANPFGE